MLRMIVGLTVGIWVARYLGPADYGLLNYGIAIAAIAGAVVGLGMQEVLVQKLVAGERAPGELLGSALLLTVTSGIMTTCALLLALPLFRPDDVPAQWLIATISFALAFRSIEPMKHWFESRVESRYIVMTETGVLMTMALTRITLILTGQPVIAFAFVFLAEAVLTAIAISTMFARHFGERLAPSRDTIKLLLRDSLPLLLAGIAIVFYMRIDQVMLGQLLGDHAVGIYSVAVRMSELWYFVPGAIVASTFPFIITERETGAKTFRLRLHQLYAMMILVSLAAAIPVSLLAGPIVDLLFGSAYSAAGTILAIHIWAGVFVALATARGRWLVLEGLQRFSLYYVGIGAVVNILLNLILIPLHGGTGAAIATLIAQIIAVVVVPGLIPQTRQSVVDFALALPATVAFLRRPAHDR